MLTRRALLLVALLAALAVAASAHGTPPGTNGRIAFERLRFQNSPLWGELFTANPDGSDLRQVTHPPNGTQDGSPDWSPDGSRIVFERAPHKGAHSIWSVAADGSAPRRLTPACAPGAEIPKCAADDATPAWSPDGKHIALQRVSGAIRGKGETAALYRDALVVTDADGRHARTLVWVGPWRGDVHAPSWSPDGKRLVLIGDHMTSKTNGTGCDCAGLYVVNADGKHLRRITPKSIHPGARPDWSPDGSTILFETEAADDTGINSNLYTIRPDGTGLRKLTHFTAFDRVAGASYSPDGTSIAIAASRDAVGVGWPDVYVMKADGTGLAPVTRTRNFEDRPDWGPG